MPKTVLALQVGKIDTNTFDAMLKKTRLRSDELPAILASGSLVQETIHPHYTAGLFQATENMTFLGILSVRTRHGTFPTAVVQNGGEIFAIVLTFDLATAESDVFVPNDAQKALISNDSHLSLYRNLLVSKYSESFCDSSAPISPLPATSFAMAPNNLVSLCLEEIDMNFMSDQNFSIFCSITGRASKSTSIEYVCGAPPSFTVVLQRVSNGIDLSPIEGAELHRAPVQGLRALLAVSGWARGGTSPSSTPISSLVNQQVLPHAEKYEIDASSRLVPTIPNPNLRFAVDRGKEGFVSRLAFVLCRDQECRLIREHANVPNEPLSAFFGIGGGWIDALRQIQGLFHPPPNFIVKVDHLNHAYLVTPTTGVEICLNEAHRLLNKHSNIVGVDVQSNEIVKGFVVFGSNTSYSLSETLLASLFANRPPAEARPTASSMVAQIERVIEGFASA
tara:strand:+ start:487 stop:1833 length:1347 start_codon:yes stop_codon:yes gene_type:complete